MNRYGSRINEDVYIETKIRYSWKCINEKCVKTDLPATCKSDTNNILNICRLICGPYGAIWPKPTQEIKLSKEIIPIHPDNINFDLKNLIKHNDAYMADKLIKQMSEIFVDDVKLLCSVNCLKILHTELYIKIVINSSETNLTWDTDESYALHVKNNEFKIMAFIQAKTVFGARHGLVTLFQLMTTVSENNANYLVMIKDALIIDKPVYPHRGLLIDTSRHFLHLDTIKRTLDGMGHSKLNVLHWHATDSHSFPLKLPRIPELAKYGAYSPEQIYTVQDITDLISHAKKRGVRIIIEIDSPSHAGNGWQWGESMGLGNLSVCVNKNPWRNYCVQPPCGQLNPINPNVYKVLGLLYKDLVNIFPEGEIFHMGGDEVAISCWNSTQEITDFMKKEGMTRNTEDFLELWAYFHNKALHTLEKILENNTIPVILWSSQLTFPESIAKYLDKKRFIIQTWTESTENTSIELLEQGYKLIISTKDAWYLDHGFYGNTRYYNWATVYNNHIPEVSKGVYGGEVCMWGEYVDDFALDARVWPRAASASERLWSDPITSSSAALYRLLEHRERLIKLGIKAEAIIPEWCYENEGLCE
ncbi:hypothetical protein PGB90_006301 [Kerria lacca]